MRILGLIGGTSWYSTVEYYRYINEAVNQAHGNNTNPPLLLYNMNQQLVHELQADDRWGDIALLFAEAAVRLRAGGAQAIMFCANTPHKVYDAVARKTDIPILHIGDAIGMAIRKSGLKTVGLVGTRFTMEDGFLVDWLKQRYEIDTYVPDSAAARRELHRIIQHELARGVFKADSKTFVLHEIEELHRRAAQAIILGCTEFPLLIKPSDLTIPVFDTTLLHSQMAVDFIVGEPGQPLRRFNEEPS